MRIAIPQHEGQLAMHFGHCSSFALVQVNPETKAIEDEVTVDAPPHEPGLLPKWLADHGATLVIAGGMGQRAQGLFAQHGIDVLTGAPPLATRELVDAFLEGSLQTGANVCGH